MEGGAEGEAGGRPKGSEGLGFRPAAGGPVLLVQVRKLILPTCQRTHNRASDSRSAGTGRCCAAPCRARHARPLLSPHHPATGEQARVRAARCCAAAAPDPRQQTQRTCTHLEGLDLAIAADGVDSLSLLQRTLLLLELREPLCQAALALGLVALLLPEARVFLPLLEQDVVPRLVLPHHFLSQSPHRPPISPSRSEVQKWVREYVAHG